MGRLPLRCLCAALACWLCVLAWELGLTVRAAIRPEAYGLTIPAKWDRIPVQIPGANSAFYWHGKLHVFSGGQRRINPIPPKGQRVRVVFVGDSLTYGYGVDKSARYSDLVGEALAVETINLGVPGFQSGLIADSILQRLDELQPDAVVYGHCLNDYMPDGHAGYQTTEWELLVPEAWKRALTERTHVGRAVNRVYTSVVLDLGLRQTSVSHTLSGFGGYKETFAGDMQRLNAGVLSHGLPPVVALALDQCPSREGDAIYALSETLMREAGMDVIPSLGYRRAHDGERMDVSPWEGHPNERAHAIFAEEIARRLRVVLSNHD